MRRAIVAIVGTAAGTAVLLGAKGGLGFAEDAEKPTAKAAGTPQPSASAGAAPAAPAGAVPGTPAPTMAGKTTAPAPQRTQPAAPGPTTMRMKDGQYLGRDVDSGFGPVQVRIKVTGGKLTSITTVKEPNGQSESARLSRETFPKLARQALAEQSAEVDTVSGATETCEAYRESLQSAMDAAYLAA